MAVLTVRNFPTELHQKLKEMAERENRSINAEIIILLEQAIAAKPINPYRNGTITHLSPQPRKFGAGKGRIESISTDFDDPIDEMKEYM